MVNYRQRLNYSYGNEDGSIERRALRIQPDDRVICITASGDRPLNLLLDHPYLLVSIDTNHVQNALFELKRAAAKYFDFDTYLSFLTQDGSSPAIKDAQLNELKAHMSPSAFEYWDTHRLSLYKGILFQGNVEKTCKVLAKMFQFMRKGVIDQLLKFDNLEEQRAFVDAKWDCFWWRKCFQAGCSPKILKWVASDPGVYAYVGKKISPGVEIYNKMRASLHQGLAKNNAFIHMLFKGTVPQELFLPYLTKSGVQQILNAPSQVQIKTDNVIDYLERSPKESFSVFSLSDIASYMPQQSFERLLNAMLHSGQKNARFCVRQLFSNYEIPPHLASHIRRDEALEKELEAQEPFFFYRFFVGTLHP